MDGLVFTNLRWPKVTFYQERATRQVERLLLRSADHIGRHQCIIRQGMTAGTELFMSGGRCRSELPCDLASWKRYARIL